MVHTIMEANKDLQSPCHSLSPKIRSCCRTRKSRCPRSKGCRKHNPLLLEGSEPFCSIQTFNTLEKAYPHQGGQWASLSLPI